MHMMPSSTPSQDLTAAWHAAAPPPPPPRGIVGMSSKRSASALFMPSSSSHHSPVAHSPSSSSLGFDRVTRGDDLPADSHAPEPERPVSRNAMAREKQRQRARTSSTSSGGAILAGAGAGGPSIARATSPAPPPHTHAQAQAQAPPHQQAAPASAVRGHSFGSAYSQPPTPHYHPSPSPGVGQQAYAPPHAMRGRYDSSPASAAPWSTYSAGPGQQQQQQQPQYSPPQAASPHPQQGYPQQPVYGYAAPVAAAPPPAAPGQWQQQAPPHQQYYDPAPAAQQPSPHAWPGAAPPLQQHHAASPAPATYTAYHQAPQATQPPHIAAPPQQQQWQAQAGYAPPSPVQMPPPSQPASYFQQPPAPAQAPPAHASAAVPFPSNAQMPPPAAHTTAAPPATYNGAQAASSRSSSIDSSLSGGSARTSSMGSLSGTVRRGLPQPPTQNGRQAPPVPGPGPGPGASQAAAAAPNANATLGRHDSVRMAAEEIMSRGPPRRKGMPRGFGPTSGSTSSSTTSNSTSSSLSKAFSRTDSSASSISSQMEAVSMKDQPQQQQQPAPVPAAPAPSQPSPRAMAPAGAHVAPPQSVPVRAASPRPIRAAPEPAPEVTVADVEAKDIIPDRPKSRGPRDDLIAGRERRASVIEATARAENVPQIFSPPPDTAPPVPTFSFGGVEEEAPKRGGSPAVPSIVVPGGGAGVPAISVGADDDDDGQAPMISISGVDDDDQGVKPSGSISISVSSSNVAQHSTTSSTTPLSVTTTPDRGQTPGPPIAKQSNVAPFANHAPASASSVGSGASCANCRKWIGGRVVHAMDTTWHPSCFVCWHCDEHLEHVAFYEHEGKPYCHFDYHELFSKRCFHCRTPIVDQRFITINDPELGGENNGGGGERCYHDLHFFCANCGDPFLDPKASGSVAGADPNLMNMVEDEDGKVRFGGREFVVHKGYPYCEKCHVNLHKPRCKGCKKPIATGDVITALKSKWHPECFCCAFCNKPFESESFFIGKSDGKPYDEACYRIKLRSEI